MCVCGGGGGGGEERNREGEERGTARERGRRVPEAWWSLTVDTRAENVLIDRGQTAHSLHPCKSHTVDTHARNVLIDNSSRPQGGVVRPYSWRHWVKAEPPSTPPYWSQRDEASVYLSVRPEGKQAYWSQDVPARHWQTPSETTLIRLTLGRHFVFLRERDKVVRLHYTQKIHVSVTGNRVVFRWTHSIHLLTWAIW